MYSLNLSCGLPGEMEREIVDWEKRAGLASVAGPRGQEDGGPS